MHDYIMIKTYYSFEDLENDFKKDILTPQQLKSSLTKTINMLLDSCNECIEKRLESDDEFRDGYNSLLKMIMNKRKRFNK